MSTLITSSFTDGQKTQYRRMVEDAAKHGVKLALDKIKADSMGWQRVLENGDGLRTAIAEIIVAKTRELSIANQFASEEVKSSYTYPKEYRCRQIEEQIERIAKLFDLDPQHAYAFARNLPKLPDGAEGWFAIPSVDALAPRFFPEVTDPKKRLCRATNLILTKIGESRRFYNYRERQITPDRFRLNARTAHALDILTEQQKGDIWIVGGQFGKRHAGRSVRRAREVMVGPEFGAHTVAAGSMLFTHPERLVSYDDLWLDIPGDEFVPDAGGSFGRAPYFHFFDGGVRFGTCWVGLPGERGGSVSLFLPQ